MKEYDIRIAIHNHGPEDKLCPSPVDVLKAVKNMDPRMGCCIDVVMPFAPEPMWSKPYAKLALGCLTST